jgi:hypothetical protein
MTQLSVNATVAQAPAIWDGPQFCDPDIYLEPDDRFTKVYHVHTSSGSTLSCSAGVGPIWSGSVAYASLNHTQSAPTLGATMYYADSIKLLPGYAFISPGWESLMQMGMGPMNSPLQLELYAPDPSWGPTEGGLMLGRHWGPVDCATWDNQDEHQLYADPSSLIGHWVDWIVGVHWTKDTTGWVDVYTRVADFGDTAFTLRYHLTGVPTAQWGSCSTGGGTPSDSTQAGSYDQMNHYEGYWDERPVSQFPTANLQRRGYVIAPDLATAEATFP